MESTQFDQLTRKLAGALSRRVAVGAAFGGSLGALLHLSDSEAKKKKKKKKKKKGKGNQPAQCVPNQSDGASTSTVTFGQKGFYLDAVTTTPRDPNEARSTSMVIRQNQTVLMDVQTTSAPNGGPVTVRVTYNKLYQGTSEAQFTVQGGMVSGSVDGRAIVPFAATAAPETLLFQDGQAPPDGQVDQKLLNSVNSLLDAVLASPPTCGIDGRQDAKKARTRAGNSVDCLACKAACRSTDAVCAFAAKGGCKHFLSVPFIGGGLFATCLAVALLACSEDSDYCVKVCRSSETCCPVSCGSFNDDDAECCEANETCLTWGPGFAVCCPPGDVPCHGKNCCKPGTTCMADGSCCPSQAACGNGTCCIGFSRCCGNQCCGGVCNGNVCCNLGTTPCGSGCCDGNCCGGSCCPSGRVCCGNTCCASGAACQGGTCVQVCPGGQMPCPGIPCCASGLNCVQCPNGSWKCTNGACVT